MNDDTARAFGLALSESPLRFPETRSVFDRSKQTFRVTRYVLIRSNCTAFMTHSWTSHGALLLPWLRPSDTVRDVHYCHCSRCCWTDTSRAHARVVRRLH